MTMAELTRNVKLALAEKLVREYGHYVNRPESFFGPPTRTPFDDVVDKLERKGLVYRSGSARRFEIQDSVHGGPVMLGHRGDVEFSDKKFAIMVRDELKKTGLYRGAQVVEVVG